MIGTTGGKCPRAGIWHCSICGETITLEKDTTFPLCSKCNITNWKLTCHGKDKDIFSELKMANPKYQVGHKLDFPTLKNP